MEIRTCVADTRVVNFDSDLVSLRRGDLDVLNRKLLACFPSNGGLASDGLQSVYANVSHSVVDVCWPFPSMRGHGGAGRVCELSAPFQL